MANRTLEGYLEAIENNEMFVVERDGRILGFGHSLPGEIVGIFVATEYKGTWVGKVLFKKALEIASKRTERVKLEATLNAVSFYEQFGFKKKYRFMTPKGTFQVEVVLMEYYL